MSKAQENKNLQRRRTSSSLLAVSLAASMAAFGCTTNRNLGNGTPAESGPGVRTAPTSGVTSGSEGETPVVPPPMTSASSSSSTSASSTSSSLNTNRSTRIKQSAGSRADAAAAIMAQHQGVRGRYLGTVNPGTATRGYVSDRLTGQLIPPAMLVNPQQTI